MGVKDRRQNQLPSGRFPQQLRPCLRVRRRRMLDLPVEPTAARQKLSPSVEVREPAELACSLARHLDRDRRRARRQSTDHEESERREQIAPGPGVARNDGTDGETTDAAENSGSVTTAPARNAARRPIKYNRNERVSQRMMHDHDAFLQSLGAPCERNPPQGLQAPMCASDAIGPDQDAAKGQRRQNQIR